VDLSTTTLYLSPSSQRAANVKRVRHLIDRQSTILIRLEFGELLVPPMPPVMAAPDLSEDEPACDGSTWQQDRPQVPGIQAGRWPRCTAVLLSLLAIMICSSENKAAGRSMAPAALPRWIRIAKFPIADHAIVFARRRNETRSLS